MLINATDMSVLRKGWYSKDKLVEEEMRDHPSLPPFSQKEIFIDNTEKYIDAIVGLNSVRFPE